MFLRDKNHPFLPEPQPVGSDTCPEQKPFHGEAEGLEQPWREARALVKIYSPIRPLINITITLTTHFFGGRDRRK